MAHMTRPVAASISYPGVLTIESVTTNTATVVLSRDEATRGEVDSVGVRPAGSSFNADWRSGEIYFAPGQSSATWVAVNLKPDTAYEALAGDLLYETPWVPFRTLKSTLAPPPQQGPRPTQGSNDSVTVPATTATTITLRITRVSAGSASTDKLTYQVKAYAHGKRPNLALTFVWKKGQATRLLKVSRLASHSTYTFLWKSKGAVVEQFTATTT